MSLASVRLYLQTRAPDLSIIETEASSATVAQAAEAHGVTPAEIAKTIALEARDTVILLVTSGTARLDNRKFKDRFGAKPRMLDGPRAEALTGHPVGGVCPFGLATTLPVFCDESLKGFAEVLPAAGSTNSALRIAPDRLAALTQAEWIDVCQ
ncbi:YbaK/EbsC family protein [Mesorhizobium sp. RP14(2022)]|uniref:YbaK/EbsC family protein n=1 Tax=Mesorhizobium liriopis TaxID=2953882 RepID=A0ABT1C1M2_9HYPH|nr:YbaK/EbsC family protein [Mesorhizobium liriopis]MCO6048717.1 YbaK/EbsC family protein [Mesorhizobium liriopis]